MKKIIAIGIFFCTLTIALAVVPVSVHAAADSGLTYTPLEPLPGLPSTFGGSDTSTNFYSYINGIIALLIIIGAMLAVVRFSVGGIMYMTSTIPGQKQNGVSFMWAGVWGLLLLISSVLILKTVNPKLIDLNLIKDLENLAAKTK